MSSLRSCSRLLPLCSWWRALQQRKTQVLAASQAILKFYKLCMPHEISATFCVQSVEILKAFFLQNKSGRFFCGYFRHFNHDAMCRLFARCRKLPGPKPRANAEAKPLWKKKMLKKAFSALRYCDLKRLKAYRV